MFSCAWLHFKKCFGKYFLMFGCVLENTIKNTFSTCCSHFLGYQTNTKRIHNIIHSSKYKQNPEKNHQIRTNKGEIAIAISIDTIAITISIGAIAIGEIATAINADRRDAGDHAVAFGTLTNRRLVRWSAFGSQVWSASGSFSLSRYVCSLSVFLSFARATENV